MLATRDSSSEFNVTSVNYNLAIQVIAVAILSPNSVRRRFVLPLILWLSPVLRLFALKPLEFRRRREAPPPKF
jgi:hypothetical protein